MKLFCKKALSVFLSLIMIFSVFSIVEVGTVTANAATIVDANNGGLQISFNSAASGQNNNTTGIDYIDPSIAGQSFFIRLHNTLDRKINIVSMQNMGNLSTPHPTSLNAGQGATYTIQPFPYYNAADGTMLDFSVTYTIDGVYEADGDTLAQFVQPAYIGVWKTSDDSKYINDEDDKQTGNTNNGFTLSQTDQDIMNEFQTDVGILDRNRNANGSVTGTTGNRTNNVTFSYNYWINATDLSTKTWESLGFRLHVQKWGDRRQHFQPDANHPGILSFEGNGVLAGSNATLSMADLVTSYNGASDGFNYPSADRPWTKVGQSSSPHWQGVERTDWGSLWNSGDQGWFRFCGNLFTPKDTTDPAIIRFTNMLWRKPSIAGNSTIRDSHFSGDINVYVFDVTALRNYVRQLPPVLSGRYTSESFNNYRNALRTAISTLANQKTNQGAVTTALNNLTSAYNGLTLANKVVNLKHTCYNGDTTSSDTQEFSQYVLAPLNEEYTPKYYDEYYSVTNRNTDPSTLAETFDSGVDIVEKHMEYWDIDEQGISDAINAIDEVLDHPDIYHDVDDDNYMATLQGYKEQLEEYAASDFTPRTDAEWHDVRSQSQVLLTPEQKEKHSQKEIERSLVYVFKYTGIIGTPKVDGVPVSSDRQTIKIEGDTYHDLLQPTLDGYTFDGWFMQGPNGGTPVGEGTPAGEGIVTVYAKWTPIPYTVTYYLNGGTTEEDFSADTYYINSRTLTLPGNLQRPGYKHTGWAVKSVDIEGGGWVVGNSTDRTNVNIEGRTGNVTLEAMWTPINYNITFDNKADSLVLVDGANIPAPSALTVPYETEITGLPDFGSLSVPGYTFEGWFDKSTGAQYNNNDTYSVVGDVELEAHWKADEYTATFKRGFEDPDSETDVIATTPYTIEGGTVPIPVRTGYTFSGWKVVSESNGNWTKEQLVTSDTYSLRGHYGNVELEAQWSADTYHVVFELNDVTVENKPLIGSPECEGIEDGVDVTFNEIPAEPLPVPTLNAYTFAGWYTAKEGGVKVDDTTLWSVTPESKGQDITLYAHWEHQKYTLTFINNDPNTSSQLTTTREYYIDSDDMSQIGMLVENSALGTFQGWQTDGGGNWNSGMYTSADGYLLTDNIPQNPYGDVVFVAVWKMTHVHKYDENWTPDNNGNHYRDCIDPDCDKVNPRELEPCDFEITEVEPTCQSDGYTLKKCRKCFYEERVYHDGTKLEHRYDEHTLLRKESEPNCTDPGLYVYSCYDCEEEIQVVITALGHAWGEPDLINPATCTSEGLQRVKCDRCGTTNDVTIPMTGHQYDNGVETPNNCTDDGYITYTCTVCGNSYTESSGKKALGHDYDITVVEPTCTDEGYTKMFCKRCNHTELTDKKEALGHDFTEVTVPATCTERGYKGNVCDRCGVSEQIEVYEPLGHEYEKTTVPPTCTAQGYDLHHCTRCNMEYRDNYVPQTGHHYVVTDTVPPTQTRDGYRTYTCEWCASQYMETLYKGGKVLVCETLYDYTGKPVIEAEITATNLETGEKMYIETDLNGYFTQVFPVGEYEVYIHKDLYRDEVFYISVTIDEDYAGKAVYALADGSIIEKLPVLFAAECDCLCHQTNIWGRLFRVLRKLIKLFGYEGKCCPDSDI